MKPLKVCVDARIIDGISSGVQQFVIGMAVGLSALNDGLEEYYFLTHGDAGEWLRPYISGSCRILKGRNVMRKVVARRFLGSKFPLLRTAYHRYLDLRAVRAIQLPRSDGTVEGAGIDLMHFTLQAAFLTNLPSIFHPHDLQHLHFPHHFSRFHTELREASYRAFCDQARMVAVASSWCKRDLVRQYALPEEKVKVIPLAPLLDFYPKSSKMDIAETRKKYLLPEQFIFYPAQTWPHKNHIGLLEAMKIMRDDFGTKIVLVSTGVKNDFFREIQIRARELRLEEEVKFLGYVNPLELRCLYQLCRCVIIPTKFEAGSFPLWEAFEAGVPAACSNVTSLPNQAGDAAIIFDPDKPEEIAGAILKLWTDKILRDVLVARGQEKIRNFTWTKTARMFRAHYRRISCRQVTEEDYALTESPPLL